MPEPRALPTPFLDALRVATVERVDAASLDVRSPEAGRLRARLAVPAYRPAPGDTVLIATADGACFVVGALGALREASTSVEAADGARATVEDGALRVYDPSGELVLEHADGKTIVRSKAVEVRSEGDLDFAAAGDLRLRAEGEVAIDGATGTRLASGDTHLRLRPHRAEVRAPRLGVDAARADVKIEEANVVTRTLRTVAERVHRKVGVLETRAQRLVERSRESWREVEGLSQTRAGRLRLVAQETLSALAQHTLLQARDDVKVKGEKIHLG